MNKGVNGEKNEPGKTRERVRERFVLDGALLHIGSVDEKPISTPQLPSHESHWRMGTKSGSPPKISVSELTRSQGRQPWLAESEIVGVLSLLWEPCLVLLTTPPGSMHCFCSQTVSVLLGCGSCLNHKQELSLCDLWVPFCYGL